MSSVSISSNALIVLGLLLWIVSGVLWLLPQKRRLLKKHGYDKTNDFFIALAKKGDADSKKLLQSTKLFIAVGLVGGFLVLFAKFLKG